MCGGSGGPGGPGGGPGSITADCDEAGEDCCSFGGGGGGFEVCGNNLECVGGICE